MGLNMKVEGHSYEDDVIDDVITTWDKVLILL